MFVYVSPFVRCPENPAQCIYLVSEEEIDVNAAENPMYEMIGRIDDITKLQKFKYKGSSRFYVIPDELLKTDSFVPSK